MTDQGPQEPRRGRRARGSVDPGPEYPGHRPRRAYPPSQYPETVPGQRRRAAPGDSQAAQDYPGPPGNRGRLAGDASSGHGRAAPPGESAVGYGPRTPAGSSSPGYGRPGQTAGGYGRARAPGNGTRGYAHPPPQAKDPVTPGPPRRATAPGQGRGTARRGPGSYPAAPPRGPHDPGRDVGGRDESRTRAGLRRGRPAAAPREEPGGLRDFYADRGPRSGARPAPDQAPDRRQNAAVTLRCRPVGRAWTAT